MQQAFDKYLMFRNRLEKVYRHIGKQARKQQVSCFRLYDHDLPEFPFIIEVYDDKLYVSEYRRRHNMSDEEHDDWLQQCSQVMTEVLGIAPENIFLKLRERKQGRKGQYQKVDDSQHEFVVQESGLQFIVNLSDYLDTGLFLDHRITRDMVRKVSEKKKVLNLFCYTGSFSVYAAAGGAASVTSVDLSKTYLNWAGRNMELNFPDYQQHEVIHEDVLQYLDDLPSATFDVIILDPPTFSNSKRMDQELDIQRDHVALINQCMRVLTDRGQMYFSTNYTRFQLSDDQLKASSVKDITRATTPFDFAGKLRRQCYLIEK